MYSKVCTRIFVILIFLPALVKIVYVRMYNLIGKILQLYEKNVGVQIPPKSFAPILTLNYFLVLFQKLLNHEFIIH